MNFETEKNLVNKEIIDIANAINNTNYSSTSPLYQPIVYDWYEKLKLYSSCFTDANSSNDSNWQQLHPGPIDQSTLVGNLETNELRRGLIRNKDYILLPTDLAKRLFSRYKGGPEFPRRVENIEKNGFSHYEVILYPVRYEIYLCNRENPKVKSKPDLVRFYTKNPTFKTSVDEFKGTLKVVGTTRVWLRDTSTTPIGATMDMEDNEYGWRLMTTTERDSSTPRDIFGDEIEKVELIIEVANKHSPLETDWPRTPGTTATSSTTTTSGGSNSVDADLAAVKAKKYAEEKTIILREKADFDKAFTTVLTSSLNKSLWQPIIYSWYERWQLYANCFTDNSSTMDSNWEELYPGPIDQMSLLGGELESNELRRGLIRDKDYILVQNDFAKKLFTRYEGTPQYPRKVECIEKNGSSHYEVILYPVRFETYLCNKENPKVKGKPDLVRYFTNNPTFRASIDEFKGLLKINYGSTLRFWLRGTNSMDMDTIAQGNDIDNEYGWQLMNNDTDRNLTPRDVFGDDIAKVEMIIEVANSRNPTNESDWPRHALTVQDNEEEMTG